MAGLVPAMTKVETQDNDVVWLRAPAEPPMAATNPLPITGGTFSDFARM
jgi:hypothetical protein